MPGRRKTLGTNSQLLSMRLRMSSASCLENGTGTTVRYGEDFDQKTYKLLEVDEELLRELQENGLSIKGEEDDEAVLCSSKSTYSVKFVSTSNTILLVPSEVSKPSPPWLGTETGETESNASEESEANVVATVDGHIEVFEISPNLESLRLILSQRPYTGEGDDGEAEEEGTALPTWDDLLTMVKASEAQLRSALNDLPAVEIGRHWRIVDADFMHEILEILLLTAVQHSWGLDALPELEVVQALEKDGYSPQLVRHCLLTYSNTTYPNLPANGANLQGADKSWALDERKVCLQYANRLLARQSKWKLQDFLDSWQKLLPGAMNPNLEMLSGEVLVDSIGSESWIHHFSVASLPRKPDLRFGALFQRRAKWEWDDLEPYLRDLNEPGKSVAAMLLKYTRKIQPSATSAPIYTAR